MQILVVVANPDPTSLNHAIAATAVETARALGHSVTLRDLCAEGFDPVLPAREIPSDGPLTEQVQRACDELTSADGIVIVHPNWWGQPPAIMKGWVDRVFRPGVAYEFIEGDGGEGVPVGLLKATCAIVLNTSNTSRAREESIFGDPLERIWRDCIFGLCGVANFHRRMFGIVCTSTHQQRGEWLAEAQALVTECFGEA